jgi:signal transduction histidine kinase
VNQHAKWLKAGSDKCEVLGMVAHDLRNPINGILSASEALLENAAGMLPDCDLGLLEAIRSASRFMMRLIDDLLEISALESGKLKLDLKPTNILSLIEQNLSLNRLLAEGKRIKIDINVTREPPAMNVDPMKLSRVIDNLVTNAIKFSTPQSRIEIRLGTEAELAILSVHDQGLGIAPHELRKVFAPFRRGRDASKMNGTGLGLAIAKRIVEAHGGQLMLRSQVGKGSTFTVMLPISKHRGVANKRGGAAEDTRPIVASATS